MNLRDTNGHKSDLLYLLLLKIGKFDFLPDLYDIVGKDMMIRLLDTFAGAKIKFPTLDEIKNHSVDIEIFMSVELAPKKRRPSLMQELADKYDVTEDTIHNIHSRTARLVKDDLGMEVVRVKSKI